MNNTFNEKEGKPILLKMVKAIQDNKQYLGEVDGLIGDGDHGMNMNKGFTAFGDRIADEEIGFVEGLYELGEILLNEIGGSMGPIYGTLFMDMSDAGEDFEEIGLSELAAMLKEGKEGLFSIVDAREGDKTLVDTLMPAISALDESIEKGSDFESALMLMQTKAQEGRDSTKDMVAKYGRSARLGERSKGVLDAGATSCCLILVAMAEGIMELL